MVCFYCGHATQVINSRPNKRSQQIWRRRQCTVCHRVWSTYEVADYGSLVLIQAKTGELTPLSRDKLLISIFQSCQHRLTALEDATALCTTILPLLLAQQRDGSLAAQNVAQTVADVLDHFDQAAAVHYRAFHHLG